MKPVNNQSPDYSAAIGLISREGTIIGITQCKHKCVTCLMGGNWLIVGDDKERLYCYTNLTGGVLAKLIELFGQDPNGLQGRIL